MNAFLESRLKSLKICQWSEDALVFFRAKIEGDPDSPLPCVHPVSFGDTRIHTWLISWCHWKLQVNVVRHASPFFEVDNLDPGSLKPVTLIEVYGCGWPL